ncbi:D-alanyl-D-alanine carboxypeptidase/D-alanyl-D-alanine-endopeptidase [Intrasporangium sp.]|uniref:D-alanyl-D-alanine carboxypeptidase/D-alanyl-D-alanine-endopeptidase n=1 Tax=Intrasporangium sp. TaxID=1925024 RepID=UPI00293A7DBA|nr:D-alanyl-D-alanine carboxypeptidase [Intrasporangium sp.]MDV3220174.1 D-alanyl-D-alanine carboxypeptidase [Intrasporangium sp.]
MRRLTAALTASAVLVVGYAALDAADRVPGLLTTRPLPPPPPTETPGTRTLPLVPQPSLSTSVRMPLGPLAGERAAPSAAGMRTALADVLDLPALADSALVVRDGQSGEVLFDRGGDELRIPASTTKLLAAAAVGQVFAPDETLTTVVRQGEAADEIVLVAGGDSLLAPGAGDPDSVAGRAGLADLADQVAAALADSGIERVTLSVDESHAPGPNHAPTWGESFHGLGIVGTVAMLGLSSERAAANDPAPIDPVGSAAEALAALLEERGVSVSAVERDSPAAGPGDRPDETATATGTPAPSPRVLGSVESAPVRDQLALALTDSDNTLTEILARQAAFRDGAGTDFDEVGAWIVEQVAALGVDTDGATLADASGLSRENRVTAELLTEVLVLGYDGRHPVLRTALEGMPIAGLSGTLADRFITDREAPEPAAGRARAKTGTLTGANSLAGSVVDDDGRLLVFAGLVAGAPTEDARDALDRFVAALADCGCR